MRTDQATLILSSLLRSPRRFQSYDLPRLTKERVLALDKLLDEFQDMTVLPDCPQALAKLDAAYLLLGAEPPTAEPDDLPRRLHPVLMAVDQAEQAAELAAWQALLKEGTP
jgi:hypothetical protein